MDDDRFDDLTRSVVLISRRGLYASAGLTIAAVLTALGFGEGAAKKKKKRCSAGSQRCGRKCCSPGKACQKGKRRKGKGRKRRCVDVCPANGGECGETPCGNGGMGSNCAATVTAEGETFCLDFAKANPIGCGEVCRRSADCGPGGVCVCINNPPFCSCGGPITTCFIRADVECD